MLPQEKEKEKKQVNIKSLSSVEIKRFINSFDYVISDAEEILWKFENIIPQGVLLVNGLINMKKRYRFLISDAQSSHDQLMSRFEEVGIEGIEKSHLLTPGKVLAHYLKTCKADQPVFSLASPSLNQYLADNKIGVIAPPSKLDVTLTNIEKRLKTYCKVGAVIVDYNPDTAFNNYALANRYLKKNCCADIVTLGNDFFLPLNSEMSTFGGKSLIHVIADGVCRPPIALCKPNLYIGQELIRYFNILMPSRVLYIGTSIEKDIIFGNCLNFQTMLLKTPELKLLSYIALPEKHKPKYFADSITDILCCLDIDYNNSFFD